LFLGENSLFRKAYKLRYTVYKKTRTHSSRRPKNRRASFHPSCLHPTMPVISAKLVPPFCFPSPVEDPTVVWRGLDSIHLFPLPWWERLGEGVGWKHLILTIVKRHDMSSPNVEAWRLARQLCWARGFSQKSSGLFASLRVRLLIV
jgi:hypothetical protein